VELEGVPTLFAGGSAGRKPTTKLWSQTHPGGLPKEFLDAAERVRIETAIRLAAEQLDKEKVAKARYVKEHDDAVAREHKDETEAKMLHSKAVSLAQKAIEQRTTFHVEQDRADTANQEIMLEKRLCSAPCFRLYMHALACTLGRTRAAMHVYMQACVHMRMQRVSLSTSTSQSPCVSPHTCNVHPHSRIYIYVT